MGQGYAQNEGETIVRQCGNIVLNSNYAFELNGGLLSGEGVVHGNVVSTGQVRPGSGIGLLTFIGGYSQGKTGILDIEIGGIADGSSDLLWVNGHVSLNGALRVSLASDFRPSVGDEFEILKYHSFDGSLEIQGGNLPDGLSYGLIYHPDRLVLSIVDAISSGVAAFAITGIPAVGNTLTASAATADPDGNGAFSYSWQSSTDGNTWSPVRTSSASYLVASADQGKQLRLVVSYTDGQGVPESVTSTAGSVPLVNDGAAAFAIMGTPAVGQTLTAERSADDPDGNGADPIFSWQASSDGSTWSTIASNSFSYTVSPADMGRELRLQVYYTDAEGFAESLTIPYGWLEELPATADGTRFTVNDPLSPDLQITSQASPDLVELQATVTATLHARTSSTWSSGFVAYNAGSSTAPGTGERIPVTGFGRFSFVATAIAETTTAIVLEPDQNSAYFLHDTYSAFFSGLNLQPDRYGRASAQRLLNIDTITMGSAGGTSIVDLTSSDYITGPMTVHGAASGTSIVWGSDADDSYISAGSDAVIYGGLGPQHHDPRIRPRDPAVPPDERQRRRHRQDPRF
jgi:hypothetical protein